jgi:hypothetical protein
MMKYTEVKSKTLKKLAKGSVHVNQILDDMRCQGA